MSFQNPRKTILTKEQLDYFQASKTHADIINFIESLNESVVGLKLRDHCSSSPVRLYEPCLLQSDLQDSCTSNTRELMPSLQFSTRWSWQPEKYHLWITKPLALVTLHLGRSMTKSTRSVSAVSLLLTLIDDLHPVDLAFSPRILTWAPQRCDRRSIGVFP